MHYYHLCDQFSKNAMLENTSEWDVSMFTIDGINYEVPMVDARLQVSGFLKPM